MNKTLEIPDDWDFSHSLALAKIHIDVGWFATDFGVTLMHPSEKAIAGDHEPLTRNEMNSIRRALFRFEL